MLSYTPIIHAVKQVLQTFRNNQYNVLIGINDANVETFCDLVEEILHQIFIYL